MSSPRNKIAAAVVGLLFLISAGRPDTAPNLLDRALSCLDIMAYDEAVSLFERILADEYKRAEVRPYLAYAYDRLERTDQAILVLDTELRLRPENLDSLSLMAFLHYKAGRIEEAERFARLFDAALEKSEKKTKRPKTPEAAVRALGPNAGIPAFILGSIAAEKGESREARDWYVKAWNLGYIPQACWSGSINAEIRKENWAEALRLCLAEGNIAPVRAGNETRAKKEVEAIKAKPLLAPTAEVVFRLGFVYDKLGKPAESLNALQTAASMRPFDAGILKALAIAHLNRGDTASAGIFLGRVLKLAPLDIEAISLLDQATQGRALAPVPFSVNFLSLPLPRYRYVFHDDPDDVAGKINQFALRQVRDGFVSDALRLLRSFGEIYENSPTIYYNLGLLANTLDRRAEALEAAMRAIALDREYRDAYDLAANVCFKVGDFGMSIALYEEAVRLEPGDPVSHYNLGLAYGGQGDDAQAEARLREAVRLEKAPTLAIPPENDRNALKRAITVTVESVSSPACQALGALALKRGKKDEALNWFQRAVEFNPGNPAPYLELGKLYLELNDREKAEEHFKRYLAAGGDEAKLKEIRLKN